MNDPADLIAALVRARQQRRWTQQHLAQLVGVSQPVLCQWENNRIEPGLGNYLRWASALGYVVYVEQTPAGVL